MQKAMASPGDEICECACEYACEWSSVSVRVSTSRRDLDPLELFDADAVEEEENLLRSSALSIDSADVPRIVTFFASSVVARLLGTCPAGRVCGCGCECEYECECECERWRRTG